MDFSKLGSTKKDSAPIDPLKVFETLPSLGNTPNDLWRGQAEALSAWNNVRSHRDVLVSLNTGAGKTIVGLLIAQSLVNESVDNVVYPLSGSPKEPCIFRSREMRPSIFRLSLRLSFELQ